MKNFVFYGDGLLCPPEGYGEQIADLLVLRHPKTPFQFFHPGEENLTLEAALKSAPLHVVGKAPDFVYLGLGHADLLRSAESGAMLQNLDALLQLILQKTRARVAITSLCEAFLSAESQRETAKAYNRELLSRTGERLFFLDLNSKVISFLEEHRPGAGQKRALYGFPMRLTSMGRVFLSHTALENLPWDNL